MMTATMNNLSFPVAVGQSHRRPQTGVVYCIMYIVYAAIAIAGRFLRPRGGR